jgi:hypothetical protein
VLASGVRAGRCRAAGDRPVSWLMRGRAGPSSVEQGRGAVVRSLRDPQPGAGERGPQIRVRQLTGSGRLARLILHRRGGGAEWR